MAQLAGDDEAQGPAALLKSDDTSDMGRQSPGPDAAIRKLAVPGHVQHGASHGQGHQGRHHDDQSQPHHQQRHLALTKADVHGPQMLAYDVIEPSDVAESVSSAPVSFAKPTTSRRHKAHKTKPASTIWWTPTAGDAAFPSWQATHTFNPYIAEPAAATAWWTPGPDDGDYTPPAPVAAEIASSTAMTIPEVSSVPPMPDAVMADLSDASTVPCSSTVSSLSLAAEVATSSSFSIEAASSLCTSSAAMQTASIFTTSSASAIATCSSSKTFASMDVASMSSESAASMKDIPAPSLSFVPADATISSGGISESTKAATATSTSSASLTAQAAPPSTLTSTTAAMSTCSGSMSDQALHAANDMTASSPSALAAAAEEASSSVFVVTSTQYVYPDGSPAIIDAIVDNENDSYSRQVGVPTLRHRSSSTIGSTYTLSVTATTTIAPGTRPTDMPELNAHDTVNLGNLKLTRTTGVLVYIIIGMASIAILASAVSYAFSRISRNRRGAPSVFRSESRHGYPESVVTVEERSDEAKPAPDGMTQIDLGQASAERVMPWQSPSRFAKSLKASALPRRVSPYATEFSPGRTSRTLATSTYSTHSDHQVSELIRQRATSTSRQAPMEDL
ncbi:uncharacterized protein L969DRAFT_170393 [Mixia osmundae IAM 14324]|uniref:Uncharacterized protein n=1 Tax=Mixia osmundae (strain CBS 9802 / IAM 14324 / JCM 22182 / KY 12970) TaxID=764103 RepID=G7E7B6_MIXOS|nr:uncharacterized protein L969DRAFT_170393 [Mixia osmundae IAM 14324]KEI42694.1 hypothetical protein L969DRAFT_170393 [Mixia osmundae IAM 14324]GAA98726.1 hypothetical protein E5Q_05414 [Mixia osmundae IAM 14324]